MVAGEPPVLALAGFGFVICFAALIAALLKPPPDFLWGLTYDEKTPTVAEDQTVELLQELGVKHYRMTVPWATLLQNQTRENPAGVENEEAIASYKLALQKLKGRGIEPVLTMWNWNTPPGLDEACAGFADRELMPVFFYHYAQTLFKHFNNLIMFWITLSDPEAVLETGPYRQRAGTGEEEADDYVRAHTMILSHAEAFRAWKEAGSVGELGIALGGGHCEPLDPSGELAAEPCPSTLFFDPIFAGDYSKQAHKRQTKRLPQFTQREQMRVHGSHMGVYYLNAQTSKYPDELESLLKFVSGRYGGVRIMITQGHSPAEDVGFDSCSSIREPLASMARAKELGIHVYGYFASAPSTMSGLKSASPAMQWFARQAVPLQRLSTELPPCDAETSTLELRLQRWFSLF